MERERALAAALLDACLGAPAGAAITDDLRGFLTAHGVQADDVDAMADAAPRLLVVRTLVRNGLSGVVVRMLARTRARLNHAATDRFDDDFRKFIDEVGPRTHLLRDVPAEFVRWATPRWATSAEVPPYVVALAEFELAGFALAAAEPGATPNGSSAIDPHRSLVFAGAVRQLHFAWAVHRLSEGLADHEEPATEETHLLGYRDAEHAVHWLELTPLASRIVERLACGDSLHAAVVRACSECGPPRDMTELATLLSDLAHRGVIVGSR